MNTLPIQIGCANAGCKTLFNAEHINQCAHCHKIFCEGCVCSCDRPTPELCNTFALDLLKKSGLPLLPIQTMIVEDEWGAVFSHSGPTDWLLSIPVFEGCLDECLPFELAGVHEIHQRSAVETGKAGYMSDNFGVSIRRFGIEGRIFTVAVFNPY